MLAEFIRLITQHIDRAIYVWGGQGQVVTSETQIRRMEQTTGDADRAIALWNKRKAAGIDPVYMFDCSGLIIWALQTLKLIDYDTTADGLRRLSKPTMTPRVGDFAFKINTDGRAYHVGIVTRTGYVTEAFGRDRGVIERAMTVGNWSAYGSNPFIDTNTEVSGLKKGDTGEAVQKWQESLLAAGYKMTSTDGTIEYGADGNFGGATERATIAFQLANGLAGSGVVGDLTWAAMVKAISTKLATALQDEAARAAYLVKQVQEQVAIINALKAEKVALTDEAVKARAQLVAAEQYATSRQAELDALNGRLDVIRKGRDALDRL